MYWHEGRDPAASRSPKSMRFSRVSHEFADRANFEGMTKLHKRHNDYLWYIWKGFNTDGKRGNECFDDILVHYAEIRLGITPRRLDELGAMTEAIILDYLSPGKAGKDLEGKDVKPKKNWVFPILHVINSHMHHFTNIPRIVFLDD